MLVMINCEPLPEDVVCFFLSKIIHLAIIGVGVHLNLQQAFVCLVIQTSSQEEGTNFVNFRFGTCICFFVRETEFP